MVNRDRFPKKVYDEELYRLQAQLVDLQEWIRVEKKRLVVIFEGRDAAGKGSTIKRVAEYLNPRSVRIVALLTPTEREDSVVLPALRRAPARGRRSLPL